LECKESTVLPNVLKTAGSSVLSCKTNQEVIAIESNHWDGKMMPILGYLFWYRNPND
jgi:hypothetical protein